MQRKRPGRRQPPEPSLANAGRYSCGAFSSWLLQYFLISLFDWLGLLAFRASSQSFICCVCDFAVALFIPLLEDDELEEDGVLVLG
jgi:hypothetical protein